MKGGAVAHNPLDTKAEMTALFMKFMRAFMECSDEIQAGVIRMIQIADDPSSTEEERRLAQATIQSALFPQYDEGGDEQLGISLEEAEKACLENNADGPSARDELDKEEAIFAECLKRTMNDKGINQVQLAERSGVGQPAISMMLSRECRPQKRTVRKLAEALGVKPEELWPV